jgi:hypothetical protein
MRAPGLACCAWPRARSNMPALAEKLVSFAP